MADVSMVSPFATGLFGGHCTDRPPAGRTDRLAACPAELGLNSLLDFAIMCGGACTTVPGDGYKESIMTQVKVIVEKHSDGYVAYPLGLKGVVVGQGDTYEQALADVKSAIRFHLDAFGPEVLEGDSPVLEAFVAEAGVSI
jgi:predicted RNase H-like HicB family nuclease